MKTDRLGILLIIIIVLMLFALAMTARAQEMKSSDKSQLSGGAEIHNQLHSFKSTAFIDEIKESLFRFFF